MLEQVLNDTSDFIWGWPLLAALFIGNLYLILISRLKPLLYFNKSVKLLFSKDQSADGELTHFQALSNSLSATVGLGNISGVAIAIYQGGAGAIFWMWIAALFGMNVKFFECALAIKYRTKNRHNLFVGGPMYYISLGMGKKWNFLAVFFAVCGLIGTLALFQINQLATFTQTNFHINKVVVGLICTIVVGYILLGGVKRIAEYTSRIVPFMGIIYFLSCMLIVAINYEKIPEVFSNIFYFAFTPSALYGGTIGYVIKTGIKRAAFSNEAGIGTAPMAHGDAKTNSPIDEGLVAMLGPFFDTIVICTLTAIVILMSVTGNEGGLNGIELTSYAFKANLGSSGVYLLGVAVFLFSFSTMLGMANYCVKCWDFLFEKYDKSNGKAFIIYYCFSILVGSIVKMNSVIYLMDIAYGLMAFANIIALIFLSKGIYKEFKNYERV